MGFFKGKPKDKETERRSDTAKQASKRSIRTIAPSSKNAPPKAPAPAEAPAPPQPQRPPQRSAPAAERPGSSGPRPAPPAPQPAAAPPQRPATRAPITTSRPADFSDGGIASARKGGPARTGDAALLEFLKKVSLLDDGQIQQSRAKAQQEAIAIDAAAVSLGFITEDQMVSALTQECWVPHLKVDRYEIRKKALDTVTREDALHYGVFPVDKLGSLLTLAMVNPLDADTIRTLESKTSLDIKKVVATRSEINQVIEKYYSGAVQAKEGSLSITQDVEPKSVTQMLANVSSASDKLPPANKAPSAPMPTPSPAAVQPDIQDIDDLLSADEAIAPSIVEPISLKPEDIEIIPDVPAEAVTAPASGSTAPEFEFEDTSAIVPPEAPRQSPARTSSPALTPAFDFEDELSPTPAAKAPQKPAPLAPEFDEAPMPIQETGIVRPRPPAPKPAPPAAAPPAAAPPAAAPPAAAPPARPAMPVTGAGNRPATSRFTSKAAPVQPGLINLVPVLEEEFQHAITHGKSHVFEKWVGLQSRNRIINAVAVENELERVLGTLYAHPQR